MEVLIEWLSRNLAEGGTNRKIDTKLLLMEVLVEWLSRNLAEGGTCMTIDTNSC